VFLFSSDRSGKQGGESIGGKEGDVAEEAFMSVWLIAGNTGVIFSTARGLSM
jgi:hypothetical protein